MSGRQVDDFVTLRMDLKKGCRILYVSSVDISLGTGPSVNEREFTLALCKTFGRRAHILVPEPKQPLTDIYNCNLTFSWIYEHYNPIALLRHRLSQIRLANALIRSYRFDFLIFRLGVLPADQVYITRRHKIPYALKTLSRGVVDTYSSRGGIIRAPLAFFHEIFVRDLTARALAIDVCTEAYLSFFRDRLSLDSTKIKWIGNATNTERFRPCDKMAARLATGLDRFDPIVGYVGGRSWERGGAQMIEIAPKLLRQYPSVGIVIVGGGSGLEGLEQRASELGIKEHCVFTGQVPYDQVPDFINAFDVGISFNRTDIVRMVGNSSQKVRQYIACGKPVVSGPGGNLFLEQEELGSIVDGNNFVQIAKAVSFWFSLPKEKVLAHCDKAVRFARANLSVEKSLNDRLEFWNSRLQSED